MSGPPTSILLSAAVWQRRYGSDPSIAGKRILVNGRPTTVVGVMPADFRLLMPPDAAVPDDLEAWQLLDRALPEFPRGQRFLRVVGRMKRGVSLADAQQDVARVGARDLEGLYALRRRRTQVRDGVAARRRGARHSRTRCWRCSAPSASCW